jgi:hypothetical protein
LGAVAVAGLIAALYGAFLHRKGEEAGRELVKNGVSWFVGATVLNYFVGAVFLLTHEQTVWRNFIGGDILATVLLWGGVVLSVISLVFAVIGRRAERPFNFIAIATVLTLLTIMAMSGVRFMVRSMLIAHHAPLFNLKDVPVQPQWGIIALFVVLLLAGLWTVTWMLLQLQRAYAEKGQTA